MITPIIIGHGVNVHFVYHVKTIPVHVEKLIYCVVNFNVILLAILCYRLFGFV